MNGVYLGDHRVMTKLSWGIPFIVPSDDRTLAPILITQGHFEVPLTKFILKHVNAGDVVFDIGANIGYFTVLLAQRVGETGKVIAYEANPDIFGFIKDNIAINYLVPQCELINKAVSSTHGMLHLNVLEGFPGFSSAINRPEMYIKLYPGALKTVSVEAEPIDVHAGKYPKVRFIKMDIEGGEYDALMGMKRLLQSSEVDFIGLEWNRDMGREKADGLAAYIQELITADYILALPNEEGVLTPLDFAQMSAQTWLPTVILVRKAILG